MTNLLDQIYRWQSNSTHTYWILLHYDTYQRQTNPTLGEFCFIVIPIDDRESNTWWILLSFLLLSAIGRVGQGGEQLPFLGKLTSSQFVSSQEVDRVQKSKFDIPRTTICLPTRPESPWLSQNLKFVKIWYMAEFHADFKNVFSFFFSTWIFDGRVTGFRALRSVSYFSILFQGA